jgi:hypothetical protein
MAAASASSVTFTALPSDRRERRGTVESDGFGICSSTKHGGALSPEAAGGFVRRAMIARGVGGVKMNLQPLLGLGRVVASGESEAAFPNTDKASSWTRHTHQRVTKMFGGTESLLDLRTRQAGRLPL